MYGLADLGPWLINAMCQLHHGPGMHHAARKPIRFGCTTASIGPTASTINCTTNQNGCYYDLHNRALADENYRLHVVG